MTRYSTVCGSCDYILTNDGKQVSYILLLWPRSNEKAGAGATNLDQENNHWLRFAEFKRKENAVLGWCQESEHLEGSGHFAL